MSSNDDKTLTPFERAKLNVKKTAENFNFYHSVEMLAEAINNLNKYGNEFGEEELDMMCNNIIKELSAMLHKMDSTWN
jgi:hypothetical protein